MLARKQSAAAQGPGKEDSRMKRIAFLLIAAAAVAGIVAFTAPASGHAYASVTDGDALVLLLRSKIPHLERAVI
jgi:hypothetical protein